ncbi:hypothetical protein Hanom_Chr06g00546561 [Helianthus anomalus]
MSDFFRENKNCGFRVSQSSQIAEYKTTHHTSVVSDSELKNPLRVFRGFQ